MRKSTEHKRAGNKLLIFVAAFLMLPPVSFADVGEGGGGEGMLTRWMGKLSGVKNVFSGWGWSMPDIFSELSPADVGQKPRIKPHFSFNQGFLSNARLGNDQGDPAWQARVSPGITISIPTGRLYTEVDYTYGFGTTQGRKTNENINTHNIDALLRYDLSADTIVGIGNNFQLSEVPGEPGEPFILETATAQFKHRVGPKLTVALTDTFQAFEDKSRTRQHDYIDNEVRLDFTYAATSDLWLGPNVALNVRDFDDSTFNTKDYWQVIPGLHATYRIGPKTTISSHVGWAIRQFDDSIGGNDTESEVVYGVNINHKLGRKFNWGVSYSKSLVDTFETDFVFRDTAVATTLDNLDREFRVLKQHRVTGSATYHLNERSSLNAFADIQFLHAESEDQVIHGTDGDEKAMEVGAGYTYRLNRYISINALYSFGRRFSRENNPRTREDYTFNKVTGGVNIAL